MNTVNNYGVEVYRDLSDIVDFRGFLFGRSTHRQHEVSILQPQLAALGFTDITWLPGESDDFGPLTRVCRCKNSDGETVYFIYG